MTNQETEVNAIDSGVTDIESKNDSGEPDEKKFDLNHPLTSTDVEEMVKTDLKRRSKKRSKRSSRGWQRN